jgi:hypothetical protein
MFFVSEYTPKADWRPVYVTIPAEMKQLGARRFQGSIETVLSVYK